MLVYVNQVEVKHFVVNAEYILALKLQCFLPPHTKYTLSPYLTSVQIQFQVALSSAWNSPWC